MGVQASFGLVSGPLPGAAAAMRLLGRIDFDAVTLEAGGAYLLPKHVEYPAPLSDIGAETDLAMAIARVCTRGPRRTLTLEVCAGGSIGSFRATGEGLSPTFTTRQLWGAATVAPALEWTFATQWALHLEVEGGAALSRPRVAARNLETLFVPDRGTISAWVGVTSTF